MKETKGQDIFACPACHEILQHASRVRVRLFMDAEAETHDQEKELGENTRQKCYPCPSCNTVLEMHYEVKLLKVVRATEMSPSDARAVAEVKRTRFQENEVELIEVCHANGLMDAFGEIVKDQTNVVHRPPKDLDRFFISFLRTAKKAVLPRAALEEFKREFPGKIVFWKAQGIGMVVSNGVMCRFIPMRAMNIYDNKARGRTLKVEGVPLHRETESFDYVRRTKFGYVPASARVFFESLLHSLGDRGRDMQSTPIRPK